MLTWNDATGGRTYKLQLGYSFSLPAGTFTGDVELFVLSGLLAVGDRIVRPHGYMFIPSGCEMPELSVPKRETQEDGLCGDQDYPGCTVLWMENGSLSGPFNFIPRGTDTPPSTREQTATSFISIIDSELVPWGNTQTSQFVAAHKKWLRKTSSGGGTWLLHILPGYDSVNPMLQNYNEEAYCLAGYCDIGEHRFTNGYFGYVPNGTLSPRHRTRDGCLFFIRVDEDLSTPGRVASMRPIPANLSQSGVDWTSADSSSLPGPGPWVPKAFRAHIGTWEGTYSHISPDGSISDYHFCKLEVGIHGKYYSQRNTYWWKDADGAVTKTEAHLFAGEFDPSGHVRIDSERIEGWGKCINTNDAADGSILFYGSYKAPPKPDTFDLIRLFDAVGTKRYRTWQVKNGEDLLKIVHVQESRTAWTNHMWIPLINQADFAKAMAPRDFSVMM